MQRIILDIQRESNTIFIGYVLFVGVIILFITIFRAATTGITYDEAYTYMHYSQSIFGFAKLQPRK